MDAERDAPTGLPDEEPEAPPMGVPPEEAKTPRSATSRDPGGGRAADVGLLFAPALRLP